MTTGASVPRSLCLISTRVHRRMGECLIMAVRPEGADHQWRKLTQRVVD